MSNDQNQFIPYASPAPRQACRRRKVSLWTIFLLVTLCAAAGVIWLKLDRAERAEAENQRQLDAERAEFRQTEFRVAKAFHQVQDQLHKETAAANARSAQIQKEIDDERNGD